MSETDPARRPRVVVPDYTDRYGETDNRFGFTTMDHVAWPTLDVDRLYRFIEEVLGGVAWATVGYGPGEAEAGVPRTVFMRIGDMLVQIAEPQDGVLHIGKDDPNWWPHWCFTLSAVDLERNVERIREMGIPVFGPVGRIGGDVPGASAYLTTPEGLKLEIHTWEPYANIIGVQGSPEVGYVDWSELHHDWPDIG